MKTATLVHFSRGFGGDNFCYQLSEPLTYGDGGLTSLVGVAVGWGLLHRPETVVFDAAVVSPVPHIRAWHESRIEAPAALAEMGYQTEVPEPLRSQAIEELLAKGAGSRETALEILGI